MSAQVTEAEYAFAVSHDDRSHVRSRPVAENLAHATAIVGRNEHAPRAPEYLPVRLAGTTDGRGIEDRHELFDVIDNHAEEKRLVAIMQGRKVDVLLEIVRLRPIVRHDAIDLLLHRGDARR